MIPAGKAQAAGRLVAEALIRAWLLCSSRLHGWRSGRWPPRDIPSDMLADYTMGGEVPVLPWYINDIRDVSVKLHVPLIFVV